MKQKNKTVLVIEYNTCHVEIFPLYLAYCSDILNTPQTNISINYAVPPSRGLEVYNTLKSKTLKIGSSLINTIIAKTGLTFIRSRYYRQLTKTLISKVMPDLIIVNTIEIKNNIYKASLEMINQRSIPTIVMAHDIQDLCHINNRHKKNFYTVCLTQYNYKYAKQNHVPIDGYLSNLYPLYNFHTKTRMNNNTLRIAIPGAIYPDRHDYNELLNILKTIKKHNYPSTSIQFNIIANIKHKRAKALLLEINQNNLWPYITTFNKRPSDIEFCETIYNSDLILPLISEGSVYTKGIVSGSIVHSGAYRKPLIIKQSVAHHMGLNQDNSILYNSYEEITNILETIEIEKLTDAYRLYCNNQDAQCRHQLKTLL